MEYNDKSKEDLLNELVNLRRQVSELKAEESEHKKIEEAVNRMAEANYRAIFDAASDAIFIHDIETGYIIDSNQKASEMFYYSHEEMMNRDVTTLSLGETPYSIEEAVQFMNKAAGGEPQLFEWLAKDKAGRTFWVEVNMKRAVIEGKYKLLAIVRDITDRKQTEERLKRIYQTFLEFGPDTLTNINKLTAICGELLRGTCALYNRLEDGMLYSGGHWNVPSGFNPVDKPDGHICYDVIRKGDDDVVVIRNLQETEYARTDPNVGQYKLQTYIGRAVKFDGANIGSLCVVYQEDYIPTEEDKRIMGIIASAIGIEENRKEAEDTFQFAHFSIERAGESVFWIGKDAQVLYVNDAACQSLGYSYEELLTMSVPDINPDFPKERWPRHWQELKERGSFVFETRHRAKDGTIFPVEVAVNYLEFGGKEYNFAFARDITERKKQEKVLERRDYQLEILSRTSQHINAVLDTPVIMRTLVGAALELVDATGGAAGLWIDGKMEFSEYYKEGRTAPFNYVFESGVGVPGLMANTMKPYISNNAEKDPQIIPEIRKALGIYNFVGVPILNRRGELLGCFLVYNKKDRMPFDTQDVFMLQGLAASGAVALENAKALVGRKRSEEKLQESEKKYRGLYESIKDGILMVDMEGNVVDANQAMLDMLGYTKEEIKKTTYLKLTPVKWHVINKRIVKEQVIKRGYSDEWEKEYIKKDGTVIPVSLRIWLVKDEKGRKTNMWGIIRDITERKLAEEERERLHEGIVRSHKKLKEIALKDPQTGLYNHRYLTEFIESEFYRARRYSHPLSIIMLDIDYFKSINDTYGHAFGDLVLKQFSQYLRKIVRRYDIIVRFGGEEFVIISSGTDRGKALDQAQRLSDASALYNFGDNKHTVKLKLSVAVVSYPEDRVAKGMDLISLAYKILDKTKDAGGNRIYSYSDISNGGPARSKRAGPATTKLLRKKIKELTKRGKQNLIESIFAFAKTIELKDHYTGEHVEKTVNYSTRIARTLRLEPEEVENIREASILHDLGKIGISDKILFKKSKLTKREYEEIKKHPQIAADIIRPIQFMHDIVPLVLYHHERWDGKGYPSGLKGEEIPIGARIIAIADVYQALTSNRPYRKAFSKKKALDIIKKGSGTQFDPDIVNIFLKVIKKEK